MKKVLITGARSGIGAAVVKELQKGDYYIYVTVHTEKQLEIVKQTYEGMDNIECMKLDITDPVDQKKVLKLDLDIFISNASIGYGGSMAEIPMDLVRENFETNVFSTFEMIQLVLKNMIPKKNGKLIIMGSLAGIYPMSFLGSYAGSKASVKKMATVLRRELHLLDTNIGIHLIEPGLYFTGFNQVMFENKYPRMKKQTYFKSELDFIKSRECFILHYMEKKSLKSIVHKIVQAIEEDSDQFIYRAPYSQVFIAKLYELFFQ